jgi:hypothetical protein
LGTCQGGVVIGLRPTANPSEEIYGQRLTFIEPICGTVYHEPSAKVGDPSGGSITVMRDELLVSWDDTPPFQGLPTTEVPDPRLIWVAQPATLCPDTAPVLIGVSGQYDPVSPEGVATAVIRSMVIECAPLVVAANGVDVGAADSGHQLIAQADSFAAPGAIDYRSSCDGGTVLTQIQVSAGFWLDGFVLGCSSLRSQSLAGQPCLDGRECQSGACAPEGSCAP